MSASDRQRLGRRQVFPSDAATRQPARASGLAARHAIDPFDLFCAYHLGITEDGAYRFQNIHQVAQRFAVNAAVIKQLLADFEMDSDTVIHSAFDMAGAQVDIMLSLPRASIASRSRASSSPTSVPRPSARATGCGNWKRRRGTTSAPSAAADRRPGTSG